MIIVLACHPSFDMKDLSKSLAMKFGVNFVDIDETSLHKNSGFFHNPPNNNMVCVGFVLASRFEEGAVKVYVKHSEEFLIRDLMNSQNISFEKASEIYKELENTKKDWLKNFFGIDMKNMDIYDLVINSDSLDNEGIISVVERYLSKMKKRD